MPKITLRPLLLRAVARAEGRQEGGPVPMAGLLEELLSLVDPARAVRACRAKWGPPPADLPLEEQIRRGARHVVNTCCYFARRAGLLAYENRGGLTKLQLTLTAKGREALGRYGRRGQPSNSHHHHQEE